MLPVPLRVLLVVGAALAFAVVYRRIKSEKILVEDAVFWVVVSALLVVLALFPDIAITLAYALGFMSASNFVYLVVIVLLLWKVFTNSAEVSRLKARVNELAQEIALAQKADAVARDAEARDGEARDGVARDGVARDCVPCDDVPCDAEKADGE